MLEGGIDMTENTGDFPYNYTNRGTGTAVNCDIDGHCWHGGTAVGSLYCCKCGKYLYPAIGNYDSRLIPSPNINYSSNPMLLDLTQRGLEDISKGKFVRILKYDDNGNFIKEIK